MALGNVGYSFALFFAPSGKDGTNTPFISLAASHREPKEIAPDSVKRVLRDDPADVDFGISHYRLVRAATGVH